MSTLPITSVILAGGRGTRLAGLYPDLPKPMIPAAGHPFLHWIVLWLQQQGVNDFVFSIGHHAEKIESWMTETSLLSASSCQYFHEKLPLGTGGGVRACLSLCTDNVLVTNGDSLIITPLRATIERFVSEKNIDGIILGKSVNDTSRYASLLTDETSKLLAYKEKIPGQGLISAGVYLFRKALLERFKIYHELSMEYDIIPDLLRQKANIIVHVTPDNTPFLDIGIPETLAQADDFIAHNFINV